jgi:hypothetical protein
MPRPDAIFRTVAQRAASIPKRGVSRGALIKGGLLSLILALAMQAGLWSIRTFADERETAVEAAAIQAPRTLVTCPHHQHDCPTDCLCPKTYTLVSADSGVASGLEAGAASNMPSRGSPDGVLREPSLVACTQHGPQSVTASSDIFLAAPAVAFFLPESESSLRPTAAESLRDGLREPLLKIPI